MITTLTVTIDDEQWPKFKMTARRESTTGIVSSNTNSILYDQAYLKFEGLLHNELRPMIEELKKRRGK